MLQNIALDRFPNEQKLPPTKGTHVMNPFDQNVVFQLIANRARVVMNPR